MIANANAAFDGWLRPDRGSTRPARRGATRTVADDAARRARFDAFRERSRRLPALTKGARRTDSAVLLRADRDR